MSSTATLRGRKKGEAEEKKDMTDTKKTEKVKSEAIRRVEEEKKKKNRWGQRLLRSSPVLSSRLLHVKKGKKSRQQTPLVKKPAKRFLQGTYEQA